MNKSRPLCWGWGAVTAVAVNAEKVMKSSKLRIVIVGGVWYHSLATQIGYCLLPNSVDYYQLL